MNVSSQLSIVFDIDGVIADDRHRLQYLPKANPNHEDASWEKYYDHAVFDEVLELGRMLFHCWLTNGASITFCTGRPERYRTATSAWIYKSLGFTVEDHQLLMRPEGNYHSNHRLKLDHIAEMGGSEFVDLWHDDNPDVIEMLHRHGVPAIWIPSEGWGAKFRRPGRHMTLDAYSHFVATTCTYPGNEEPTSLPGLLYAALGLGEAGEVQGKIKKVIRDDDGIVTPERRAKILDEMGDLMWYIDRLAYHLDSSLTEIMAGNVVKLGGRMERGTIKGDGDDR